MVVDAVGCVARQQQSATCANSSSPAAGSTLVQRQLPSICIVLSSSKLSHSLRLNRAQHKHPAAAVALAGSVPHVDCVQVIRTCTTLLQLVLQQLHLPSVDLRRCGGRHAGLSTSWAQQWLCRRSTHQSPICQVQPRAKFAAAVTTAAAAVVYKQSS
jgi:hypothetical protein